MGFVSNSSSSSFVLITTKENHEKAMKDLSPLEQKMVKAVTSDDRFLGKDVVKYIYSSDRDGNSYLDYAFDDIHLYAGESMPEDTYEIIEKYKNLINKNKEEVITTSIDW